MATDVPRQPEHTPDQADRLRDDLWLLGTVVCPVIQTADGAVIDGAKRLALAQEMGIPYQTVTVDGLPADQHKRRHAMIALQRGSYRTLTQAQMRARIAQELKLAPHYSDRYIGDLFGADHKTVAAERRRLVTGGEIPQVRATKGSDGKTYPVRTVAATNKREETAARKALATLPPDITGPLSARRACRLASKQYYRRVRDACLERSRWYPPNPDLWHGDFRQWSAVPDDSIDAIITDPPYHKKYLPLWQGLGEFAARKLTKRGILAVLMPTLSLLTFGQALATHLRYRCSAVWTFDGERRKMHGYNIVCAHRLVLIYSRGRFSCPSMFRDVLPPGKVEKGLHPWQQSIEPTVALVEGLTLKDMLVCDPFLGSGTTGVACQQTGRRFIGADVDPACIAMSQLRLLQKLPEIA